MYKVCIVTLMGYTNYGNRLQNYALDQILKSFDCEVYSGISYIVRGDYLSSLDERIKASPKLRIDLLLQKRIVSSPFWKIFFSIKEGLKGIRQDKFKRKRQKRFLKIVKKHQYILPTIFLESIENIKNNKKIKSFDAFVAGSDQIWNPSFEKSYIAFLKFSAPNKRLSFAASLGIDDGFCPTIDYIEGLNEMSYISVRERTASEFIAKYTNKNVHLSLDPTLVLEKNEWLRYEVKPKGVTQKYILTYFLGELPPSSNNFINNSSFQVIRLNDKNEKRWYSINPQEFVWLFHNAEIVLTDSFHGSVFSILFHKEFYVFRRKQIHMENMFSRISDLLSYFDLNDQVMDTCCDFTRKEISDNEWKRIDNLITIASNNCKNEFKNELIKAVNGNEI